MSYAANAYARTAQSALTPREAEAAVLMKAAGQLRAARGPDLAPGGGVNAALCFNQRVWTLLGSCATAPDSALPEADKRNFGRLAVYVLDTCLDAMIAPTPEKLDRLISINHTIAAGLQGDAGA